MSVICTSAFSTSASSNQLWSCPLLSLPEQDCTLQDSPPVWAADRDARYCRRAPRCMLAGVLLLQTVPPTCLRHATTTDRTVSNSLGASAWLRRGRKPETCRVALGSFAFPISLSPRLRPSGGKLRSCRRAIESQSLERSTPPWRYCILFCR